MIVVATLWASPVGLFPDGRDAPPPLPGHDTASPTGAAYRKGQET